MANTEKLKFKKVTGERILAALVDSIIVGILSSIPTAIILFKDGFGAFINSYIDSTTPGTDSVLFGIDYMLITALVGFAVGIIYFAYIPYKWNGQTLGKKMMSIKAIDEFGNNPTLGKHVLRAIQVWDTYLSVIALPLLIIGTTQYSVLIGVLGSGISLLVFISLIMMLAKDDGRGLHDSMAGSYVVKADIDLDRDFVEKTTQMGEWAEVDYDFDKTDTKDKKDDWYE